MPQPPVPVADPDLDRYADELERLASALALPVIVGDGAAALRDEDRAPVPDATPEEPAEASRLHHPWEC